MKLDEKILDNLYDDFKQFVGFISEKPLIPFRENSFIDDEENYKYQIHEDASKALQTKSWKVEEIGNGKILDNVKSAIQIKDNNLIYWEKQTDFSKLPTDVKLEQALFNLFRSEVPDEKKFNELDFDYQTIAYLFFLKDYNKYLPISQKAFDLVFDNLLKIEFKTCGKRSWENYLQYNSIIEQVQHYLLKKDSAVTVLDAHSFLWILGCKYSDEKGINELLSNFIKRKVYFEMSLEIINYANSFGANKWGVSFEANKIRIKIGSVIIASIEKDMFWLALDKPSYEKECPENQKLILENCSIDDHPYYVQINTINSYYKDNDKNNWNNFIKKLHFKAIETACKKYPKLRKDSQKTCYVFLWLLEKELKLNVPIPSYSTNNSNEYIPKTIENHENNETSDNSDEESSHEIDYLERHKKQMENGKAAEEYVYKEEIKYLTNIGKEDLAKKVRIVSSNSNLGYDIISFDDKGKEKQIEVKSIGVEKKRKTFFITANELKKSETLPNYYIYCVENLDSKKPRIYKIKNPKLNDSSKFRLECITYKVAFE